MVLSRNGKLVLLVWLHAALLFGCATQKTEIEVTESGAASREEQRAAQEAIRAETPAEPTLKRKLAIGRFSNETRYGQTFWRDREYDPLGKQAADMLTARLVNTNRFMFFPNSI